MLRTLPSLLLLCACHYGSEAFQRDYVEVACHRASRCTTWATLDLEWESCRRDRLEDFEDFFGPDEDFDPTVARECLHDLATADCELGTYPYGFAHCQDVYGRALHGPFNGD
jgi:hypothetical protein